MDMPTMQMDSAIALLKGNDPGLDPSRAANRAPVRDRTKEKREALRLDLLQAARELVTREGFANLSIRKITQTVGCAVGMVYAVFEDFDDLAYQMNAITLRALYQRLFAIARKSSNPTNAAVEMGRAYTQFSKDHPHLFRGVFEHIPAADKTRPEWYQQEVDALFALLENTIQPLFGDNSRKAARASRVLWAGLHGICYLSQLGKLDASGSDSLSALSDSLVEHYLDGMVHA